MSVIAPTSAEARTFLNWLNAEDPALASETQRPANATEYQLPKLDHVPSYLTIAPELKELPPRKVERAEPSAMPPGPVEMTTAPTPAPPVVAPSAIRFSEMLRGREVSEPALAFHASSREAPQTARFRVAVDGGGIIRYCLLEQSSGDAALDEQARKYLALCRFEPRPGLPNEKLTWATATIDFGTDLALPPAAESGAVIRVSLAAFVTIYLLLFLAAVFLLWIVGEWNRRRREQRALRYRLRCVICAFEFEDRTPTLLPRCPRCGSLNERFKLDRI